MTSYYIEKFRQDDLSNPMMAQLKPYWRIVLERDDVKLVSSKEMVESEAQSALEGILEDLGVPPDIVSTFIS